MTATGARAGRGGGPRDWSTTDKCLLAGLLYLPFVLVALGLEVHLLRHPDDWVFSWVNRDAVPFVVRLHSGFAAGWLGVVGAALCLRRRVPESRTLVHLTVWLAAFTNWTGSYLLGAFTNLWTGFAAIGSAAIGFVLFDRRAMLPAVVGFYVLLFASTTLEQLGIIPYAPYLAGPPFAGGKLSAAWLIGFGSWTMAALLAGTVVAYYVVERWRESESELARTTEQLAQATELISRYVAAQVAEHILLGRHEALERHDRRKVTLFFSDIVGFSNVADLMEPEDLSRILNEYLAEMTEIADRHGGTVDKFIGDAIMILFGAPTSTDDRDQALRAVRMAVEMQARMRELDAKWSREGMEEPFRIRIGINTGVASVGNFGTRGRMDYTAIGRQVNLAARLQTNCEPGGVLISHYTWVLVQEEIPCLPRGEIQVKGIHHPVKVYEIAAAR